MLQNKVTLRSSYKFTKIFMEPAINPKTGRFAECVRQVDYNGDMILSDEDKKNGKILIPISDIIEIYDGIEFDLDEPYDAAKWEAIRYSKKIPRNIYR